MALNPLRRSLPSDVKGGFYLVGDAQKCAPLSESGLEVEPKESMDDVEGNHDGQPKGYDCQRMVMVDMVAMPQLCHFFETVVFDEPAVMPHFDKCPGGKLFFPHRAQPFPGGGVGLVFY